MTRKMAYIGFSYLIGLFFASFFNIVFSFWCGIFLVLFAFVAYFLFKKSDLKLFACLISLSLGLFYYSFYGSLVYQNIVEFDGDEVIVSGELIEFRDLSGDITEYKIDGKINGKKSAKILCYGEAKNCEIGDKIHVMGTLKTPENTYVFNSYDYYKSNEIFLVMNYATKVKIEPKSGFDIRRILGDYREHIYDVFDENLDKNSSSILSAMLLGDKSGVDDVVLTQMYRSGIGHIMAVSGVHLTVVCSILWYFIGALPFNKYAKFVILMVPLTLFVILVGSSNSVLRAAIMIILVYGGSLFKRRADIANSLGIAGVLLTLSCPYVVRDASFLLSFTGVLAIGVISPYIVKLAEEKAEIGKFRKSFIHCAVTSVLIFPVATLFFNEISIISPISNLFLIPICTAILVLALIVALTGGISFIAAPILYICGILCKILLFFTELLSGFKLSYIPLGYRFISALIVVTIVAVLLSILLFKRKKYAVFTATALLSFCIIAVSIYRFIPNDNVSLVVIGDGKSATSIIIHDNKNASIIDVKDGGGACDEVVKYLNSHGLERLESLILACDSNVSEAIYKEKFSLVEVGSVVKFCIENVDKNYESFGENGFLCDVNSSQKIEMPDFTATVFPNNYIEISVLGNDFLAYLDGENLPEKGYCGAIICDKITTENFGGVKSDFWIFSEEKYAENLVYLENVFINKNVKFNIYCDKITTEEVSYGFNFG